MHKIRMIGVSCLLVGLSTHSLAVDALSLVGAQIAQSYNVAAQQESYQDELRHNAQIEVERVEAQRHLAQVEAEQKIHDGHSAMLGHDDDDYRVLPSTCVKESSTTEFMCYAGNDNYYKVTKLPDGYRWTGFNTPKNMSWTGQMSKLDERTVYSGTDASGKLYKKTCSKSACFE
jgi:hypothetical protein